MHINAVVPSLSVATPSSLVTKVEPKQQTAAFSDYFNEALAQTAGADYVDKTTAVGLMTGTLDDMHTAPIAAQKAELMLNLTLQVRTKIIESYQEVMRMQV